MFFNVNKKFFLCVPDTEGSLTVSGDRDRPGPTESTGNNGGSHDSGGNTQAAAMQRQINAILSDANFNNVLKELQKKVRAVAPYAKITLYTVEDTGRVQLQIGEINLADEAAVSQAIKSVSQVKNVLGLGIRGEPTTGFGAVVDTPHRLGNYQGVPNGNNNDSHSAAEDKS
ncbi:hypothetical protein P4S07_024815, partial [Serratia marcescens]|nr:hypothetical protein [Serratia marcescens]